MSACNGTVGREASVSNTISYSSARATMATAWAAAAARAGSSAVRVRWLSEEVVSVVPIQEVSYKLFRHNVWNRH